MDNWKRVDGVQVETGFMAFHSPAGGRLVYWEDVDPAITGQVMSGEPFKLIDHNHGEVYGDVLFRSPAGGRIPDAQPGKEGELPTREGIVADIRFDPTYFDRRVNTPGYVCDTVERPEGFKVVIAVNQPGDLIEPVLHVKVHKVGSTEPLDAGAERDD